MDETVLLCVGVALIAGFNAGLWALVRRLSCIAGVAVFILNLLAGSPLIGWLCWKLAYHDGEASYADDVFFAIGGFLLNAMLALLGTVVVGLTNRAGTRAQVASQPSARRDG